MMKNKKLAKKQERKPRTEYSRRKIFPTMSIVNPLVTKQIKYIKRRHKLSQDCDLDLPLNASSNRNTRWTHSEKNSPKLAMSIFGD